MIRECLPDDIGISVSYPMPGTKFHAAVREQLGEKQNWTDSSDLAMLYEGTFTTAYYRQLHKVVHKEYRARLASRYLGLTALVRNGGPRSLASAVYGWLTLPFERRRLERLAKVTQKALSPPPQLPPGAAAMPTPQPNE
jgi:anaerobic magnesium-protoporphyrin IX monomethyl ester cyclase